MRRHFKNLENLTDYEIAKRRVNKIKKFYIALFIYAIGVGFYISKEYFGIHYNFFPLKFINYFVIILWTTLIVAKGIRLFISESILGTSWEQQKINEIMNKDNQQTQKWK